jgi:2-polyprenyl-6-methoxyphenol hydroxylase-like FAD-dependent oxidoreductase
MICSNCRIGIIGAGTSGIYLASLLRQQGYQVDVFERAAEHRTDGCGILLVMDGIKALDRGNPELCRQIIASGVPVKSFEFRNLKGEVASRETVELQPGELPGMLIHRTAILNILLESLPPECLHLNAEFVSATRTASGVRADFSDGSHWEGDLLVGVDGIKSRVREFVVPGVKLFYLGDLVWRGVVEDDTFCKDGEFIVYMRARGIYANFFDLGEGLSPPFNGGACTPRHGQTHWGFFIERELERSQLGRIGLPNNIIPSEELAKLPEAPRSIIESTPLDKIVSRYSYDIDRLPQLYRDRIVLIGDAAHAKSPTRARGMTAGLEDALALSRHLSNSHDIPTALQSFQDERMPIVHQYQQTSREMSLKIGRMKRKKAA